MVEEMRIIVQDQSRKMKTKKNVNVFL